MMKGEPYFTFILCFSSSFEFVLNFQGFCTCRESESELEDNSDEESAQSYQNDSDGESEEISSKKPRKRVQFNLPDDENSEESENSASENSANSDESDIEDDVESGDDSKVDVDMSSIFSKNTLDNSLELRKATAVTNQLSSCIMTDGMNILISNTQ